MGQHFQKQMPVDITLRAESPGKIEGDSKGFSRLGLCTELGTPIGFDYQDHNLDILANYNSTC